MDQIRDLDFGNDQLDYLDCFLQLCDNQFVRHNLPRLKDHLRCRLEDSLHLHQERNPLLLQCVVFFVHLDILAQGEEIDKVSQYVGAPQSLLQSEDLFGGLFYLSVALYLFQRLLEGDLDLLSKAALVDHLL